MDTQTEWRNYSTKIMLHTSEPEGCVSLAVRKNEPSNPHIWGVLWKDRNPGNPFTVSVILHSKRKPDLHYKAVIRPHGKERRGNGRGSKTPHVMKMSQSESWLRSPFPSPGLSHHGHCPHSRPSKGLRNRDNWLYADFRCKTIFCFSQRERNQACEGPQSLWWSSTNFS